MTAAATSAGTWDPVWEQLIASRGWGRYPTEPVIREVMRAHARAADRSRVRILDLGCGIGANAWFAAREGFSVAAIDGSPTGVDKAKAWLSREGLSADFAVGDFTLGLPWPEASFDVVIDAAAIASNPLPAFQRAVGQVARVLKPGGFVISLGFSDRTWGYGRGAPVPDAPGCFTGIDQGPLAGIGAVQFLGRAGIDAAYRPLRVAMAETYSYSLESLTRMVEYWAVKAVKG